MRQLITLAYPVIIVLKIILAYGVWRIWLNYKLRKLNKENKEHSDLPQEDQGNDDIKVVKKSKVQPARVESKIIKKPTFRTKNSRNIGTVPVRVFDQE